MDWYWWLIIFGVAVILTFYFMLGRAEKDYDYDIDWDIDADRREDDL